MDTNKTANSKSQIANRKSQIPWRRVLGYLIALAALLSLGYLLAQTWGDVVQSGFKFDFEFLPLIVSLVLLVVARGFAVEAWRRILISLGNNFDFGFGARVWFMSNLTRYIPGNIWQVATMMVMVQERGVSKTNALLSQVVYTALALAMAGLLGVMFVFVRPEIFNGLLPGSIAAYAPIVFAIAFAALVVVFALPITNRLIVAVTARVMRREINAPTPTFARGLVPPLFSLVMWLMNGVAFYLFINSITPLTLAQLPAFIAMNAGAYWIGYVSFLTPSGLGVREGVLALMLSTFFPTPVAVALSLATRLWTTAGELFGVVLVWIVPSRGKPNG